MKPRVIVDIRNVSFQYQNSREQLKQVSLSVREGECVVVTGPSGSGKTTLTRLVNGLIPHFYEGRLSGTVELDGGNAGDLEFSAIGRLVGSVFQDSRSQFFASIVEEEIAFCGENYGMDARVIRERVDRLAEEGGIAHLLRSEVHKLSSGEKQKVAVASARLTEPALLVMDEPSANLDMPATRQLAELLAALKAGGKTLIIAEHRLYYLLPLADRIVYMRDGEIAAEWTPTELLALSPEALDEYGLRSPVVGPCLPDAVEGRAGEQRMALRQVAIAPGRFRRPVLEEVDFALRAGEVVAIAGPNGTGKTTLAKTICGLIRERSGTIAMGGRPTKAKDRLRKLWFVMQDSDYQLFADSVLKETMLSHEQEEGAPERAERLLQELGLWELRDRHPASLSGGQKQRLVFAVGLMKRPDMLILDEPTSGLDGRNMRRVVKLIRRIADTGVTVLIITHDHELVFGACDRLLFFRNGRLQAEVPVESGHAAEAMRLIETTTA
ncbi:ABC transporter ATP-binding protein [Cohnella sp.]|uniref:ABC transporter ATP-binding protein n=1 Tax=Cohnella sp. TaxID=1883426 RepID=UPI0035681482